MKAMGAEGMARTVLARWRRFAAVVAVAALLGAMAQPYLVRVGAEQADVHLAGAEASFAVTGRIDCPATLTDQVQVRASRIGSEAVTTPAWASSAAAIDCAAAERRAASLQGYVRDVPPLRAVATSRQPTGPPSV